MDEKTSKILKKIDHNFVENYEDMLKYKKNLDNILISLGFKSFKSYNDFCIKIKENTINYIKENNNVDNINNEFFSIIINRTLRNKIKDNKNYDKKLKIYFNTDKNNLIKNDNN